jgi:hypothetical protein
MTETRGSLCAAGIGWSVRPNPERSPVKEVTLMGLLASWLRDLRTRNLSPRTIDTVEIEATFADA